jgi:hypothetical protein
MSRDGEAGVGMVEGHPFIPRGAWWTLWRVCGLSEAAHTTTTAHRSSLNGEPALMRHATTNDRSNSHL